MMRVSCIASPPDSKGKRSNGARAKEQCRVAADALYNRSSRLLDPQSMAKRLFWRLRAMPKCRGYGVAPSSQLWSETGADCSPG